MSIYANVDGVKKEVVGLYGNVNGEKKEITSLWANKDGAPVQIYGASKIPPSPFGMASNILFIIARNQIYATADGITYKKITEYTGNYYARMLYTNIITTKYKNEIYLTNTMGNAQTQTSNSSGFERSESLFFKVGSDGSQASVENYSTVLLKENSRPLPYGEGLVASKYIVGKNLPWLQKALDENLQYSFTTDKYIVYVSPHGVDGTLSYVITFYSAKKLTKIKAITVVFDVEVPSRIYDMEWVCNGRFFLFISKSSASNNLYKFSLSSMVNMDDGTTVQISSGIKINNVWGIKLSGGFIVGGYIVFVDATNNKKYVVFDNNGQFLFIYSLDISNVQQSVSFINKRLIVCGLSTSNSNTNKRYYSNYPHSEDGKRPPDTNTNEGNNTIQILELLVDEEGQRVYYEQRYSFVAPPTSKKLCYAVDCHSYGGSPTSSSDYSFAEHTCYSMPRAIEGCLSSEYINVLLG